jgi:hypothetical protein
MSGKDSDNCMIITSHENFKGMNQQFLDRHQSEEFNKMREFMKSTIAYFDNKCSYLGQSYKNDGNVILLELLL